MRTGPPSPKRIGGISGGSWRHLRRRTLLSSFKEISDYGLIGDLKTCALVGIDGSIDWLCIPRFDSPSIFAAILDRKRGGTFELLPDYDEFESRQYYEGHTNVLITEFKTKTGHVRITDFMPCFKVENTMVSSGEIHRQIRCIRGTFKLNVLVKPRLHYGQVVPKVRTVKNIGYTFESSDQTIHQEVALITAPFPRMSLDGGKIAFKLNLKKGGKRVDLILRYGGAKLHHVEATRSAIKLRETKAYWEEWVSGCKYEGKWKEYVFRSALALKLLQYSPTWAIIAAPTTSLPEQIGGVRNWDYRYSWIRDSSFVLWAFHSLGHNEEALTYLSWLTSIFYLTGENLQVMLGIGGERDLSESEIRSLGGYKRSAPVRVGNAAWEQFQLDVYGILLDAIYFSHKHAGGVDVKVYEYLVKLVAAAVERNWRKPDCGIWEVRGEKEHFVYSKMWCWVAMDRAVKIADSIGMEEDARKWSKLRDKIKREIMRKGWSKKQKTFVRSYGSEDLDSANLLMPQLRFIDAKDPKMIGTIEKTMERLMRGKKFLYRYFSSDGLPGQEGAFLICSFWLVNCLTLAGRYEEAEALLDSLIENANHLGLFSEEIDPQSGRMLGNFPQAFTHMGFITAAVGLGKALNRIAKGEDIRALEEEGQKL